MKKLTKIALMSFLALISLASCHAGEKTSSSSSGSSVAPTSPASGETPKQSYAIDYGETSKYYTVAGPDTAQEGSTVTFTVTLSEGYTDGSVEVEVYSETGDQAISVTKGENGQYFFTMVKGKVIVDITYSAAKYSITSVYFEKNLYAPSVDLVLNSKQYEAGSTVTFSLTKGEASLSAYNLNTDYAYFVNGVGYEFNLDTSLSGDKFEGLTFVMPREDVEFAIVKKAVYSSSDKTKDVNKIHVTAPSALTVYSSEDIKFDGTASSLNELFFKRNSGFKVTSISYSLDQTTWTSLTTSVTFTDNIGSVYLGSIGSTSGQDLYVKIEGEEVTTYNFTMANTTGLIFWQMPASFYAAGDSVQIYVKSSSTSEAITPTFTGVSDYTMRDSGYYNFKLISFAMPANDVSVSFAVTQMGTISVQSNAALKSYKIRKQSTYGDEVTSLEPGVQFYVVITLNDGYYAKQAYLAEDPDNKVSVTSNWSGTYFVFTMPASGNATVVVDTAANGKIVLSGDENVVLADSYASTAKYNSASNTISSAAPGSTFYVFPKFKTGYSANTAKMGTTEGTYDSYYKCFTFTMPSDGSDATIAITSALNGTVTVDTTANSASTYVDSVVISHDTPTASGTTAAEANSFGPGEDIYVVPTLKSDYSTGYKFGQATMSYTDKEGQAQTSTASIYTNSYGSYYRFAMPTGGVNVTITFKVVQNGTLHVDNGTYVESAFVASSYYYTTGTSTASDIKDYAPGEKFYLITNAATGYKVTKAVVSDGTTSTDIDATYNSNGNAYFNITMPDSGVCNVTFEGSTAYTVSVDSSVTGATFAIGENQLTSGTYTAGETVQFMVTAENLYTVTAVAAKDHSDLVITSTTDDYDNVTYSFTMPSYNVVLTATVTVDPNAASFTIDPSKFDSSVVACNIRDLNYNYYLNYYNYSGNADKSVKTATLLDNTDLFITAELNTEKTVKSISLVITKTDGTKETIAMTQQYGLSYRATPKFSKTWASLNVEVEFNS